MALPPWYGPGGAKGPGQVAPSPYRPPPPPRTINVSRPGSRSIGDAGGMARTVANSTSVNTAPTNPWLDPRSNQVIYPSDSNAEQGILDKLTTQLEAAQRQSQANFTNRLGQVGNQPVERVTPTNQTYTRSGDFGSSVGMMKNFAETGGYSEGDLAALRARGVSPIRSVYANAQRNLNRQRSLQGGYAPGFAAAATRMAREQSDMLSDAVTRVNADIADRVAKGKMFGIEKYGGASERENELINQISGGNVKRKTDVDLANADAANRAMMAREELRNRIEGESTASDRQFSDQALAIAELRNRMLQSGREGQLSERTQSRSGSLNWEDLLQRGGNSLINAMMTQYGG